MEHPCEKCGSAVEDGRAFCPHCRAPQVRVKIADLPQFSDVDIQAEAASQSDPPNRVSFHAPPGRSLFRSAFQAGLLGVAANLIPFGVGMILTGIIAALLYQRNGGEKLTTRTAARLGAMAGTIAFIASALLTGCIIVLLHLQQQFRDLMMKAVEDRAGTAPDADMQKALQWLHTPEGFAIALLFSLAVLLVLSMLASALGSTITAAVSRDRNRGDA